MQTSRMWNQLSPFIYIMVSKLLSEVDSSLLIVDNTYN